MKKMRFPVTRRSISVFAMQIVLIGWAIVQLYPVFYMFINGLKTEAGFAQSSFAVPLPPMFGQWAEVWRGGRAQIPVSTYFVNSVIVTAGGVLITTIVATMAAYSVAKYVYRGKRVVEALLIATLAIPIHATLLPVFVMLGEFGLRNSHFGLIAVYTAFWLPFTAVVMRATFYSFPNELIESARMDGAGELRILGQIVVPISTGAISSLAIVNAIGMWSELLYAFILMNQPRTRTLTVGLLSFKGEYIVQWTQIFAGLSIASLPMIVLFVFFQKNITKGMTVGAIK
jgi:raffinose/stachyose/melibiose transport system permease protein